MLKKATAAFLSVIMIAGMFTYMVPTVSMAAKKTKLKKTKVSMEAGEAYKITLKNKNKKAKYSYKSGSRSIAKVNKAGKITGIKKGNTKITVTQKLKKSKKKIGVLKVTVRKKKAGNNQPTPTPIPTPTPVPEDSTVYPQGSYKLNNKNKTLQLEYPVRYEESFFGTQVSGLTLQFHNINAPSEVLITIYDEGRSIGIYTLESGYSVPLDLLEFIRQKEGAPKNIRHDYTINLELRGNSVNGYVTTRPYTLVGDWFPDLSIDQKEITGQTKTITGRITNFPREVESVILVEVSTGRILQSAPITGEITGGRISGVFSMNVDFSEWESGTAFRIETEDEHFGKQFTLGP